MGTISHLIPGGPDRGPHHLPESHYLISECFTQRLQGGQRFMGHCSIRSMSHAQKKMNTEAEQLGIYGH